MPVILKCRDKYPLIASDCFIAPNATIVGEVDIKSKCSIWFNAVIRGDVNSISIGEYSNIQDNVTIHGTYQKSSTNIGNQVNIGHNAVIHGCTIHDYVLVGMGAIIMDKTIIESNCIIGAGSVVLENTHCEEGFLYAGTPAKKIKPLTEEQLLLLKELPKRYVHYSSWFDNNNE